MKRIRTIILGVMIIVFSLNAPAQTRKFQPDPKLLHTIKSDIQVATQQYRHIMQELPANRFPQTYDAKDDSLETSGSGWWCSGFYPGTLFYLYEETGATDLYSEATKKLNALKKEQYNTTTHDLGFMMYCSYGNAYRINPEPKYRDILFNSAKSLASRFNPTVGCIKSWDSDPGDYLVIIDNMMNLELLFWATEATGDSSYYNIAVQHANTTIKNHFRPDTSSYHVLNYDPKTGEVQEKRTAQGYSDESAWARGQSWGLYGFTVAYRYTGDNRYLKQANGIAHFLLNNPNLPADKIPYWDYNAPNIPNTKRDASAGAIMASALLELSRYTDPKDARRYFRTAETIIRTLSSDHYLADVGTNGGFILKHGVGNMPNNSEVDVPLTYADYYFVEAMRRYKQDTQ